MSYAELLCLTNFSFQYGASHPRELFERAYELGYAALAITDECSLAGIVRAHEAAEVTGIPLIIGSFFRFEEGDRITLLAPTQEAYTQLCELISKARGRSEKGAYTLSRADFDEINRGLRRQLEAAGLRFANADVAAKRADLRQASPKAEREG